MSARMTARKPSLQLIIDAALHGELSEDLALALPGLGPEAVVIAMLATSKRIAELEAKALERSANIPPSTPSGMIPVYAKPPVSKKHKRPGAREGYAGTRRTTPERIDRRESHRLERCPECDGPLQRCERKRTRIIEDIPAVIEPVVTEHTVHRDYCPRCKKHVEPVVPSSKITPDQTSRLADPPIAASAFQSQGPNPYPSSTTLAPQELGTLVPEIDNRWPLSG